MKAKWHAGQYNIHTLRLSPSETVELVWSSCGFEVRFAGRTLDRHYRHLADAQIAGENFARQILLAALAALPDAPPSDDGALPPAESA